MSCTEIPNLGDRWSRLRARLGLNAWHWTQRRLSWALALGGLAGMAGMAGVTLLGGCASRVPLDTPAPGGTKPVPGSISPAGSARSPSQAEAQRAPARNWDEYRLRAAQRLVEVNATMAYTGVVPEPLLAIPVLEVELKADGSVATIKVLRHPSQAKDTTQLAIDAVHRAAPFGDVSRLPKPWKYVEVFLFNDDRQFKPRTLD